MGSRGSVFGIRGSGIGMRMHAEPRRRSPNYALNELPQPQVDFVFGLLNLNPEPSSVST